MKGMRITCRGCKERLNLTEMIEDLNCGDEIRCPYCGEHLGTLQG